MTPDLAGDLRSFTADVERDGWSTLANVVDDAALAAVERDIAPLVAASAGRGGIRNLLTTSAAVGRLARSRSLRDLASSVLGHTCAAVRVIYFDKTPDTNWRVVWHQDLSIAVAQEVYAPGYGPWSAKDGVVHVHPPSSVLEQMLAVRVHLDDCDATNGPVRVLSGSHRSGRMTPAEIDKWKEGVAPTECHARRGGVLAFRPLLLHASSPALSPKHRRVIHFEFAAAELAAGVRWHSWVGADAGTVGDS